MKKGQRSKNRKLLFIFAVVLFLLVVFVVVKFLIPGEGFSPKIESYFEGRAESIKPFDVQARESRVNEILRSGKDDSIEGIVEVWIVDDFDNKRAEEIFYLQDSNFERYKLYGHESALRALEGEFIFVEGKIMNKEIVISRIANRDKSELLLSPELGETLGEQRVAVVLINFENDRREPFSVSEVEQFVFDEDYNISTNSYFLETSYGKSWLGMAGEVNGWIELDFSDENCSVYDYFFEDLPGGSQNLIEIFDDFINYSDVDRLLIFQPQNNACSYGGISSLGKRFFSTNEGEVSFSTEFINKDSLSEGGIGTVAHEFGHGLGLRHANFYDCGEDSYVGDLCLSEEYGDNYDVMGRSYSYGYFNAPHKEQINWIDNNEGD